MSDQFLFLAVAVIAVTVLGLGKGGLVGLGTLATPLLALVMPPVAAAALLLPILIVQDVVSVWSFRHSWNRRIIAVMAPGAVIGIGIGWAFAATLPVGWLMGALGLISIAFALWRLWVERGGRIVAASTSPDWVGALFGVATGFTSQIGHAGGPPFQIWVTPRQLPHEEYVGTGAVLFAIINWVKVPAYIALGGLTLQTLRTSAMLMPLAIASTFAGVWVVRRIKGRIFYTIVYLLMILLGGKLLLEAF